MSVSVIGDFRMKAWTFPWIILSLVLLRFGSSWWSATHNEECVTHAERESESYTHGWWQESPNVNSIIVAGEVMWSSHCTKNERRSGAERSLRLEGFWQNFRSSLCSGAWWCRWTRKILDLSLLEVLPLPAAVQRACVITHTQQSFFQISWRKTAAEAISIRVWNDWPLQKCFKLS